MCRRGNVSRYGAACIWAAALSLAVGTAGRVFADAITVVSGLNNPNDLQLYDGNLYFVDTSSHANDTLADVSTDGGTSNVLFSGLANYEPDIGGYSGIGNYSVGSAGIFGGYGDYDNTTMFAGNAATGTTQSLASSYGGIYLAQSDGNVYYSSNFRDINSVPATGGSSTTVASGVWVRGMTTDNTGAYFQDYWSQDILKFSYATQSVSTLTGPQNASPFATDSGSLYVNVGGGGIDSVAQTGGTPATLISGSVTGYAATNGNVFYTNGNTIEQYSVSANKSIPLATVSAGNVASMTTDGNWLYYSVSNGYSGTINKVSIEPTILPATTPPANPGTICNAPVGTSLSGHLLMWNGTQWQPLESTVGPRGVSALDTSKPTDVITHGWNDSISDSNWTASLAQAIQNQQPNANILAWDWSAQAVSNPNDPTEYPNILADIDAEGLNGAAASARRGAIQGVELANELHALGVNDATLSLIGHSNGGAVIGTAASRLIELASGVKIDSLTTLDTPELQLTELPIIYQKLLNSAYLNTRDYAMQYIDPSAAHNVSDYYSSDRAAFGFGASWQPTVTNAANLDVSGFLSPLSIQHLSILNWYIGEIGGSSVSSAPTMMADGTADPTITGNTSLAVTNGTGRLHPITGLTDLFGAGTTSSGINATPVPRPSGDGYSVRIAGAGDGYLFKTITLPSNAEYLDFSIEVDAGTFNDFLTVSFGSEILYYRDFSVNDGALTTVDPIYIGDLAGQTRTLLFALNYGGTGSPSALIDNVSVYAVPEPASLLVIIAGFAVVMMIHPRSLRLSKYPIP